MDLFEHNCRVCGLFNEDPPWGDDGESPSYDICPCCGVEFGYEDYTVESTKKYRAKWISEGAMWFTPKEKPKDWDLVDQIKSIPVSYR